MNKIPKIIHYCWFGYNKMSYKQLKYIRGWHFKCPNYKFVCWSEKNFNIHDHLFTLNMYKIHNWAFLSDYVRLCVLKKYGGIYLDTDVELLKNLDPLLKNNSFIGLEDWDSINSGLIYAAKPNDFNITNLLNIYDTRLAYKDKLSAIYDNTVNIVTDYFHKLGFKYKNKKQVINGCTIYPTEYFCPQKFGSTRIKLTSNTYSIHHYMGSWVNKTMTRKREMHIAEGRIIRRILGRRLFYFLYTRYLKLKK